jgi:hypothetical protein
MRPLQEFKLNPFNRVYQFLNQPISELANALGIGSGNQESEWTYTEVDITSSQILNMGTTPIELLPAAGTDKYYDLKVALEYTYGTLGYAIPSNDQYLVGGGNSYNGTLFRHSSFNQGSDIVLLSQIGAPMEVNSSDVFASVYFKNDNIVLTTFDGNDPSGGDGTIKAKIWYKIITFG